MPAVRADRRVSCAAAWSAALLCGLSGAVAAQTGNATLPPVNVTGRASTAPTLDEPSDAGSRLGLTVRQTPASIEVLSGDEARARGDTSVYGAVTRLTGITGVGSPGNGSTSLSARGFVGHGSVQYLVDGVRMSPGAGTVTFPFDLWTVGRIEALRGPASVLFGEASIGGAINITPKRPSREQAPVEAFAAAGSRGYAALGAGTGGPLGSALSYRVDGVGRRGDGEVDRGDFKSAALAAALRFDIAPSASLTLQYDGGRQRPSRYWGTPLTDGTLPADLRRENYNAGDAIVAYDDDWTRLRFDWAVAEQLRIRNEAWHLRADRHWKNIENYAFVSTTGLVSRSGYLEILHDQTQIGDRLDATWDHTFGAGIANRLLVGAQIDRIRFQHTNNSPYGGSSSVAATGFDPGVFSSPDPTLPKFRTTTRQLAFFAEDRLSIDATKHLVAGIRRDRIDYEREPLPSGAGVQQDLSATTLRLGAVWDATPDSTLYAQWSRGADPVGSVITLSAANAAFDLSTGRQIEAGLKQSFLAGRGEWTLAAYRIVKNKLLTRDPADPNLVQQIGQQSSRGVEVAVAVRPLATVQLSANAALLRARFDDFSQLVSGAAVSRDGNVPPNVPERVANAWLAYDFAPSWQAGVGVRHVGKRFTSAANTETLPSFTVFDASLGWRVNRAVTLTARAFNVGDRFYAETSYGATQWLIAASRRFELAADLSF